MLAAFKEYLLPYLVYVLFIGVSVYSITSRAAVGLLFYAALVAYPSLWYPSQELPLGSQILTLLALSVLIGGWRQRQQGDPASAHGRFVLFLIFWTYLSFWFASVRYNLPLPVTGANEMLSTWKNFALMLSLYFASYMALQTEKDIKLFVGLALFMVLIISVQEMRNFSAGASFSYNRRVSGPFWLIGLGANHFAAFLAHTAAVAIGLFVLDKVSKKRTLFYLGVFFVSLYPIFFSYSRGAYVAVLFAAVIVSVIRSKALMALLVVFLFLWDEVLPSSVVERITMTEGADGQIEESAASRFEVWALAKSLFADHPIFGVGFMGFYFETTGMQLRNPHNYYWQTAAEMGLFGLLLLGLFFLKSAWAGWQLYRKGSSTYLQGLGLGFLASIGAVAVTNIFGDRFSQLEVCSYLWLMFGAVDRALVISAQQAPPLREIAPAVEAGRALPAHHKHEI